MFKGVVRAVVAAEATYEGRIEIDADLNPKTIDLIFTGGPEKGKTSYGIYELDGDTWKMCLTTGPGDRPKQCATNAGTGHALEILQREVRERNSLTGGEIWNDGPPPRN